MNGIHQIKYNIIFLLLLYIKNKLNFTMHLSQEKLQDVKIKSQVGTGTVRVEEIINIEPASKFQAFLLALNTQQYWPLWIGITWYLILMGYTFWGLIIPKFNTWNIITFENNFTQYNFSGIIMIMFWILVTISLIHQALQKKFGMLQYMILLIIVFFCKIIGSNQAMKKNGLGDSIWCIIVGIFYRLVLPSHYKWIRQNTFDLEFFIKISIVLLAIDLKGASVVGAKALSVAWLQTLIIIPIIFLIGYKILGMKKQDAIVTSCGVCICGSSAAVTIGDCVPIQKQKITSLIAVMSIFTIPCIPTLPLLNLDDNVIGAWIGGSVDSTGAVLASAILKNTATVNTAIIIKMLQNILIGVVALILTFIWSNTCNIKILWTKFPKFVIGFIIVAIITTLLPTYIVTNTVNNCFSISEWYASLSFVIIGLEIQLVTIWSRIKTHKQIIVLYLIGQSIDLSTTLGMAYLFIDRIP